MDGSAETLYINVWDEDVGKDDHIGRCEVPLQALITSIGRTLSYTLFSKGEQSQPVLKTGELFMKCDSFVRAAAPAPVPFKPAAPVQAATPKAAAAGDAKSSAPAPAPAPVPVPVPGPVEEYTSGGSAPAAPAFPVGKLSILLVSGIDLKDTDLIGKLDPYVILKCGKQEVKSEVMTDAGCKPTFNLPFTLYVIGLLSVGLS